MKKARVSGMRGWEDAGEEVRCWPIDRVQSWTGRGHRIASTELGAPLNARSPPSQPASQSTRFDVRCRH